MLINKQEIEQLEKRYRTTFINSLAGFRQAVLVGTRAKDGSTNLAIFNSLIHLGASPALFGILCRPDSVPRHTYQHILENGAYTLNFVKAAHYKQAHHTSARYEQGVSEFDKAGFTPLYLPGCTAPFVQEAVVKMAMKFEENIPVKINGTNLIVGSIMQVEIPDELVLKDGFIQLSAADVLITQGLDAYFTAAETGRLPYAKPLA